METNDVVEFRTARWVPPACFAIAAMVLTIAAIAVMEDPTNAPIGLLVIVLGIVFIWTGAHYLAKSTKVGPEGIVEKTLRSVRRYEWARIESWQYDRLQVSPEEEEHRQLTIRIHGKLLGKTWDDYEVGRPSFERFLELFRQYAGKKERPGRTPLSNPKIPPS